MVGGQARDWALGKERNNPAPLSFSKSAQIPQRSSAPSRAQAVATHRPQWPREIQGSSLKGGLQEGLDAGDTAPGRPDDGMD